MMSDDVTSDDACGTYWAETIRRCFRAIIIEQFKDITCFIPAYFNIGNNDRTNCENKESGYLTMN